MRYGGHLRNFRTALKAALAELVRLKIVAKPRIERSTRGIEQATWTRLGPLDPDLVDEAQPSG